jgi:predicted metal-dependent phosphoesterase TrpH
MDWRDSMSVDLHIHSTVSDGTLTPEQIVAEALRLGLKTIAIADHDHVAATAAAQEAAEGRLLVLPAVEISTELDDTEVHILGYMMDCTNSILLQMLSRVRESWEHRAQEMVRLLRELGAPIQYEQVQRLSGGGSVGRPHVARALVECGMVGSQGEAFRLYLRRGRPAYVPRYKFTPTEAVDLVRQAGGAAILAHPGLCRDQAIVNRVLALGIDGLEAYHTNHTAGETKRYLEMAARHGLLVTGGSDSHGPEGPIPVKIGSVSVPGTVAEELIKWAETHDAHILAGG